MQNKHSVPSIIQFNNTSRVIVSSIKQMGWEVDEPSLTLNSNEEKKLAGCSKKWCLAAVQIACSGDIWGIWKRDGVSCQTVAKWLGMCGVTLRHI